MDLSSVSVLRDLGVSSSPCGYCGTKSESSSSHDVWAYGLTVTDYQELVDRGWRRSGKHLYKPVSDRSCCSPYTIRLDVTKFTPSKSQTKLLKRIDKLLCKQENKVSGGSRDASTLGVQRKQSDIPDARRESLRDALYETLQRCIKNGSLPSPGDLGRQHVSVFVCADRKLADYSSNIAMVLSAKYRKSMNVQGSEQTWNPEEVAKVLVINLEKERVDLSSCTFSVSQKGFINITCSLLSGESVDRVQPPSSSIETRKMSDVPKPDAGPQQGRVKQRQLEVQFRPPVFDAEAFAIYCKYQAKVHGDSADEITEDRYTNFLCETPLLTVSPSFGSQVGYGTIHMHYLLDGKLVAVGVCDILPRCLSSVYFFYDPDLFGAFSPGTYSALREIDWVKETSAHKRMAHLKYYYMGYYIHSCSKMRYKAQYTPSELLCPVTYKWFDLEESIPKIEQDKFARLASPNENVLEDMEQTARETSDQSKESIVLSQFARGPTKLKDLKPEVADVLNASLQPVRKLLGLSVANRVFFVVD